MKALPFRPINLPKQAATMNDGDGENGIDGYIGVNSSMAPPDVPCQGAQQYPAAAA